MGVFFRALLRFISIALGFILTTFVAAGFLTFVLFLDGDASWIQSDVLAAGGALVFLITIWFTIGYSAIGPFLLVAVVLEFGKFPTLIAQVLTGGAVALFSGFTVGLGQETNQEVLPHTNEEIWLAILAAGFIGGFIYWLLTGHRAGRWLAQSGSDPGFDQD